MADYEREDTRRGWRRWINMQKLNRKQVKTSLPRIWISLSGTTTPLHYDGCHGILIQLVGRNALWSFHHEDTHGLHSYGGILGTDHANKVPGLGHCFPSKLSSSSAPTSSLVSHLQPPDQHNLENLAEVMDRWPRVSKTCPGWWISRQETHCTLHQGPGTR